MTSEEQDNPGVSLVKITENPSIVEKVDYIYVTYAQFTVNNLDVRIALGDRMPPNGNVKPLVGIILPHDVAKSFVRAMSEGVSKIDILLKQLAQNNQQPVSADAQEKTPANT